VGILTRYLIRSHGAPFLFALSILTGLVFLNTVAQRIERLAGRGLEWDVIGEFLFLSLPHTVALTLPMSVLVAVLYTFSQLTATNEVTAMAAGGIKPTRLLFPLLGVGTILAGVMLIFNDRILPESNHQLKNLMVDISRKSPTFQLREGVVNEIQSADGRSKIFLQAQAIDPATNQLTEVVIYDVGNPGEHRTIRADHGTMAFNAEHTDLFLTLFDGRIHEVSDDRIGQFQRLDFQKQIIPLRGVTDVFERQVGGSGRTDREMSIAMLTEEAERRGQELDDVLEESLVRSRFAVREALGRPTDADSARTDDGGFAASGETLASRAAAARTRHLASIQAMRPDGVTQTVAMNLRTGVTRAELLRLQMNRYRVEVHKKYSIAFACIVFVLVGAPLAVRFPRGGVGMVIAASVATFAVYWMGLIGGEKLADKGHLHPFWSMWTVNLVFLALGLFLSGRMGREMTTSRGGGWDDLLFTLKSAALRPLRRSRRSEG
jgi:lipopolysaccharide export system permease protein